MVDPSDIRILYIEDDEPLCDLFKVAVETHGYSVDVAFNGEDGLALHAAQPYDLLAIDCLLPDMTGIDIARKLLTDDPNIPIVIVTEKGNEQIAAESLALGVYNYVIKDNEKIYLELLPNIIGGALKSSADRKDKIKAVNLLRDAFEGMSEGFLYFDADDRLALVNNKLKDMYPLVADVFVPGVSYEKCMRMGVERGQWGLVDDQDKEDWIQERLAYHYDPKGTFEFNTPDGRTIRVEEKKTPQGGIVGVRTDITDLKKIEHQLRESEERFRSTYENAVAGIVITLPTIEGQIIQANPAMCKMLGYTTEELTKKTTIDLTHPDDQEATRHRRNELANDLVESHAYEKRYICKDGSTVWVRGATSFIRGRDGEPQFIMGMSQDITERKQSEEALRESESRYRLLTESIGVIPWEADATTFQFTYVGPQAEKLLGYSIEDWYGHDFWPKHIHPDDREATVAKCLEATERGKDNDFEYRMIAADGRTVWLRDIVNFIPGGNGAGILRGVMIDITELKEIDRMKNEFISIASHELRTPLTSLKGALGLIHSDVVGQIPETMAPMLEIAHRNSERLGRLIDDILDMEKLDAGKMEFSMQPLPVPSLIDQAISEHAGYGIDHGVSFVIEGGIPSVTVLADEDRLMQVFSNLMSNAAKFSPEGTVVRLSAREKEEDVRISITDEGPGIPKEFHEKIFEKFGRADNSDTGHQGGTGLGLSIAKAVIERHGGDLGFQTETDVGTTFYFDLPKTDH